MITLTERAQRQIQKFLTKRGHGLGIKLGVRTSGCSGLAYVLEYIDQRWEGATSFQNNGVEVLIDEKDLPYITGTTLDYVREGLNEGFKFINPNVKDQCGCGESFRV